MNQLIGLSGSIPLGQLYFRSAQLHEALSEHSEATIWLESDSDRLEPNEFLGKNLCLEFETRGNNHRYFDGVVVEMALESQASEGRCAYRLELRSWTWLLGRNQEFRVYQQRDVCAIAEELIGRHAHPSVRFSDRTTGVKRQWDYLVQYGESDLDFLRRILEQEGIYFYFEHAREQHTLVLVNSMAAHAHRPAYQQLVYDPAVLDQRLSTEEVITRLSVVKSIRAPRHAHGDYNFKTPSASLLTQSEGLVEPFNQAYEIFEYPGEFETEGEGKHYSQLRHEEVQARQHHYKAHTSARGVCVGSLVDTHCEGNPVFSRTLLVIRTQLSLQESQPEASGGVPFSVDCQFEAIEALQAFRPARQTPKPLVSGPLPALVVGPAGREIHTDEFGRIKIQFYWDRYGQRNQDSSCWVRVASPAAGKGWGFFALPRIGQEVMVSFEAGDPDRPLVTGVVYNAAQPVPYPLPEHQTVSGWRTRSTENGTPENFNELRFEDKLGSEYVWFQAEKDFLGLIKNDSRTEIGGDVHRLIHGKLVEEIRADVSRKVLGQVCQQVEQGLHLTVNDDLLTKVNGLLGVVSQGQVAISAAGQFSLKCDSGTDLQSRGNLNLETVSQANIKAGTQLKMSAGSSLTLSVGGSSIAITPAGVFIRGASISLNGSHSVEPASSAIPHPPEAASAPAVVEPPADPIT